LKPNNTFEKRAALSAAAARPHLPYQQQHRRASTATTMAATGAVVNAVPTPKPVAFEPEAPPKLSVAAAAPEEWEGDLLIAAVTEDDIEVKGARGCVTYACF
jgi:hypothetical protein